MAERTAPRQDGMPAKPFKFLLVEGGDEKALCEWLIGDQLWPAFCCWTASGGSKLADVAALASKDPNFEYAESVRVVFDVEADLNRAGDMAERTFQAFGSSSPGHGRFAGDTRRCGLFLVPDGASTGGLENLCRPAASRADVARCVDAFEACSGVVALPLTAQRAKRWVNAYIEAVLGPRKYLRDALAESLFKEDAFKELKQFLLAL